MQPQMIRIDCFDREKVSELQENIHPWDEDIQRHGGHGHEV